VSPKYVYDERDLARWQCDRRDLAVDADGRHPWVESIVTPKGTLHHAGAWNEITWWESEHLIKNEQDFALWNEFYPVPIGVDFTPVRQAREKLGDRGIIRSHPFSPGQGSPCRGFSKRPSA
jgi:hypothetical protein